jgi:hypothetical protein
MNMQNILEILSSTNLHSFEHKDLITEIYNGLLSTKNSDLQNLKLDDLSAIDEFLLFYITLPARFNETEETLESKTAISLQDKIR